MPLGARQPRRTSAYTLIPVLGAEVRSEVSWFSFDAIKTAMRAHFDEPIEHVTVLWEGRRADMFVGETSAINGRHIRNFRATAIYRAAALAHDPTRDPESLPAISGPAVLFDDRVWV